jgi:hypothetical protein
MADQFNIANAVMTPEQEDTIKRGVCFKCDAPTILHRHFEGGRQWVQCSLCTSVYVLHDRSAIAGVDSTRGGGQ